MSKNIAWLFVLLGGICEIFWVSGLKYSHLWWHYVLTTLGIGFSFVMMMFAIRKIELGVAYSVFVGIGAAGIVLAEILFFDVPAKGIKIFFIITLMLGVLGLKFADSKRPQAH